MSLPCPRTRTCLRCLGILRTPPEITSLMEQQTSLSSLAQEEKIASMDQSISNGNCQPAISPAEYEGKGS
ncbi:hypothetical protein BT69DRAFT_1291080 [Atractiella rhizophila]|nr:hypothetical protein BT69DRAFT_1291080 [Atractiella rhizophila]